MKRYGVLLLLAICMVLVLCSCGKNETATSNETQTEQNDHNDLLKSEEAKPENTTSNSVSSQTNIPKSTSKVDSLTDSEKLSICYYIQSYYSYYDLLSGGNSGDKYSDAIWKKAAKKYDLSEDDISIVWSNGYSYGMSKTPSTFLFSREVDKNEKSYYEKQLKINISEDTARLDSVLRSKSSKSKGGYINSLAVFSYEPIFWDTAGECTIYADNGKTYEIKFDEGGAKVSILGEDSLDISGYYELDESWLEKGAAE